MADALQCPFEKAIISTRFGCELAEKYCRAEKEGVLCRDLLAQTNCHTLVELFRANAQFALKLTDPTKPVAHGKEMKLRCGGLIGLQMLLHPETDTHGVTNIHSLVQEAIDHHGTLRRIPYSEVVKSIAAYKHRR